MLSGPTFAREVGLGLPTAMTVASRDNDYALALARGLSGRNFRAYASTDVTGVEVGGATKNVLAIGAGISDGLGFGAKKTQVVFVFENQAALRQFVNSGWELGAQATAAITDGKSGGAFQGAASVSPGVWMYQMTDKGLAAEITAKGTKYYRNDELN